MPPPDDLEMVSDATGQKSGMHLPHLHELDEEAFARVVEYIDKNLVRHIAVKELAKLVGISHHYFSRRFKLKAGVSPDAFVVGRRMKKARSLLIQTELSQETITEQIGLSHMGNFRKQFRRHFGINPSQMRDAETNVRNGSSHASAK